MIDVNAQDVFDAALALSESKRAELAERLWTSLEEASQNEVHEAWAEELHKRLEEYRSGEARILDGPETMAELKRRQEGP